MHREKKTAFKMPYAGIDTYNGLNILYGEKGDFSMILHITNPVLQYGADPDAYSAYQSLLLNIIKILGEGHIIQKQDVFIRRKYIGVPAGEFLQQKYHAHFEGREYTDIKTYLVITRQVKNGTFYTFDKKVLADFFQNIAKLSDLLASAGLNPRYLNEAEINRYISKVLSMEFASAHTALNNMRCGDEQLNLGNLAIRCISMVNTDSVDLPEKVGPYIEKQDNKGMRDFPVDNLSFLHHVPGYRVIIYNQLLEIPAQQMTLNKLELKRKRHSGVPDPANLICVEDIDLLLVDVARENQLLVNAHYSMVVCAKEEQIRKAANYIETALFQQGIIPSRNAYNQLELFRCALPGNGVELKRYDWFLTTADAALCFFFKESLLKDEPSDFLVRFTDRQGIPVGIDLSDLPMRTGRINARNRFCLGPSGAGKSFLINSLVEQYMQYNMDVVIVDTGHSYSGLCAYYQGKYITWADSKPITMNPFAIDESEYNIEKKDFLCTLISLLWKGAEGTVSAVERDVIASVVSAYYSQYFNATTQEDRILQLNFNTFYEFALKKIPKIKSEEQIPFDLEEFRYVLKKFYQGGEFGTILNEAADQSLFSARFIVFEIDNLKENKILFPVVTLIIMDVFIQKMRHRTSQRKALIIEEAWKAIASPLMAGYILYLYKTVRKFWGEAIVVTQELADIIGNAVVKDSILSNSDTIFLLDQSKFKENYKEIAQLLSITETEQKKIFTINKLDNKEGRGRFKEVYIRRGAVGEVYGVENSIYQYLTYTTEKPEKAGVETYTNSYGTYQAGLEAFVFDLEKSGLPLEAFVRQVNRDGLPAASSAEYFKPNFFMKTLLLITGLFLAGCPVFAQIYVDPITAGAMAAHSGVINGQLNKTNDNLTLIQRGQLAVTGQLMIVNDLQQQIYRGLSEVSGAVRSLLAIQDIAEISVDIVADVNKAVSLAQSNPALLLFAEGGAREFRRRGTALAAEVSSFVLQGGVKNLMDSGERAKLLNRIRTELMILRGVAYGMQRTMYWAKQRGILNSLNPYAGYINIDRQIADDIIRNAKYLKQ